MSPNDTRSDSEAPRDLGRSADSPAEIPRRGWIKVTQRVIRKIGQSNMTLVAAGVAFYGLLALFPAIGALISIYGLVADPADVDRQFVGLAGFLPADVSAMISQQMRDMAARPSEALGIGLASAIALALWSATKGTKSLISALNIAYDEAEERGFIHLSLVALAATAFVVVLAVVAIGSIVAVPVVLGALAVIYRFGPCRRNARWQWVTWGSALALTLWLTASSLFSFYVANFGSYNATYGSVGAVVVLLMWLFLSALIVLLGAVVNAEMERQTAVDTTQGGEQPMGQRGAYVADNLPADEA